MQLGEIRQKHCFIYKRLTGEPGIDIIIYVILLALTEYADQSCAFLQSFSKKKGIDDCFLGREKMQDRIHERRTAILFLTAC